MPDLLPAGKLVNRLDLKVRKPKRDLLMYPSAAFTDRYVVAVTATSTLRVIDRTTWQESWSTRIPPQQGTGPCLLPALTPVSYTHLTLPTNREV